MPPHLPMLPRGSSMSTDFVAIKLIMSGITCWVTPCVPKSDTAPEEAIVTELTALRNFVNGHFTEAASGQVSEVVDPSTGEAYATAPVSGSADVEAALRAAAAAFETWRETTPAERSLALLRFPDAIEARSDDLVKPQTPTPGHPLTLT